MSNKKYSDRVKGLDGFHSICPYVMPKRTEAEVSINETFDITELKSYLAKRKAESGTELKLFHAICTAVARTIYNRPLMNYYISGKRFFKRRDITLSFVAKKQFADGAEEALMFLTAKPEMNLFDIAHIILGDVDTARKKGTNDVGDLMDFLGKLPRFMLNIVFGVVRMMEYFNIMPASLRAGDPNYSTVLLSNLGSIGCGSVYHHLSNYGTCSMIITIGTMHPEKDIEGNIHDVVDMSFTLDERIADGFYFARSLKLIKYMLEHPQSLEEMISAPLPIT